VDMNPGKIILFSAIEVMVKGRMSE
jgi:hypothetical protein